MKRQDMFIFSGKEIVQGHTAKPLPFLKHSHTSYKRCFLSDRKHYEYMKMMLFMLWFFEEESQVHAENVEAKQQLL